ncbi:MAG: CBS domain-containing protein [Verrucomicrobia bacterium]|nr:MAG: CBS domain-containing protein [Verrucomicrobiota bacterium]
MSWSFKLLRVAGIEIRIHVTFFLLLAWIGWSYYALGGPEAAVDGIVFILAIFGCVLLHELGHALAARVFGIRTPDITLLPIGGLARLERMPDKPAQELIVALAGPAVNVVIAAILLLTLNTGFNPDYLEGLEEPQFTFGQKLAAVNVALVLFNLIPAFPMDGGRVLRAILAMFTSYGRATLIAARIGQGLAFVFGFLGLMGNPMLLFIALFVFLGASQENTMAQMKDLSTNLRVMDAMMTELVTLRPEHTVADAVEALLRTSQHEFPVLDIDGRILGVLTRNAMVAALKEHGPDVPVAEVMHTDLPVVEAHAPFEQAFRLMNSCQCPAIPVVDYTNRFVGLITPENIGELMMVRAIHRDEDIGEWRARRMRSV